MARYGNKVANEWWEVKENNNKKGFCPFPQWNSLTPNSGRGGVVHWGLWFWVQLGGWPKLCLDIISEYQQPFEEGDG